MVVGWLGCGYAGEEETGIGHGYSTAARHTEGKEREGQRTRARVRAGGSGRVDYL